MDITRPGYRRALRRLGAVLGIPATVTALTASVALAAGPGGQPADPDEIWPQEVRAQIASAPCDPAGPSGSDATLAAQLNPQLADKMAGHLNAYRMSCARVVTQAVRDRGLNPRAAAIAMATAIVESGIMNYSEAVDHDSLGLFQQRPSMGWCSPAQCVDPVYATNRFLDAMEREFPGGSWNTTPIGDVAAEVQKPAAQYRYRYGVEARDATVIVDALWSGMGRTAHPYPSGLVVSARSADGRLETFAAGSDGIHHSWQTAVNGGWSDWRFVGGPQDAQLSIASNSDGRLELFALSGNTFDHMWQTTANGEWSGWANFGGGGYRVAAGNNADGRIEVFASNTNGVFHKWQTGPGTWSNWEGLGGPADSRLAMETSPDGRLEVFALSDTTFGHLFQTAPNGGWSAWEAFGGGGQDLAVSHNQDGRLEVFASSPAGVFHKWQTSRTSWSDWEGTGGIGNAELATGRSVDGRVEVFAINSDVAVHTWQSRPNASYSAWETFGTGGTEITAGNNADGRIEVLGTSHAGVYHKWQTGFTTWSDWAWLNDSAGPAVP
ncbi:hypothetical protein FHS29_000414 [Saccharothrix tamanrassetensis]|uniref:PLL-like beta propeller domain-containing protein n=1 Tax=Saccharothrix tamanrassetensis TaxID=1051531 RepID=A0A841CBW1_9PSEU|nr:peptidase M23 [Saccharothrix tamanrassetensis]MBB5953844.1 hypothetical protein [Saccharothrix tamanrassetensis]